MPERKKKDRKETMNVSGEWEIGAYKYKAGKYLDEFAEGLKNKEIVGSVCSQCGKVYVRPRYICGRCMKKIEERTTVSDKGTVQCYSITEPIEAGEEVLGMDPVERGIVEEGERIILTVVQFDGADACMTNQILMEAEPEDVFEGMRVEACWEDEPTGKMSDLRGVVPLEPQEE